MSQPPPPPPPTSPSYPTLLFLCCLVAFGGYFGCYMRLPVVPLYAETLGADTVMVGGINAAFLLVAGLLSLPLGLLADRVGYKFLTVGGVFILAATSFMLYFSETPRQLVGIYLLAGLGLAAFGPTTMKFVADISPVTHLGRSYGWYTTAIYVGMSLGPAAGGFVAQEGGFLRVFLLSGLVILVTFGVAGWFLPRSHLAAPHPAPAGNPKPAPARRLFRNRPLLGCWLATLGGCFGAGMFLTFLPLHAQHQGLTVGQIGLVFSAQGMVNALSRLPFGHLSDLAARRTGLVVLGLIGFAAAMAGLALSHSFAHFMLAGGLLGAAMGLAFTSIGALIAEVVPPESRGLAMGGYNTCIYFGMALSSLAMGAVIREIGFPRGFLLTALVILLFVGVFYVLMRGYGVKQGSGVRD